MYAQVRTHFRPDQIVYNIQLITQSGYRVIAIAMCISSDFNTPLIDEHDHHLRTVIADVVVVVVVGRLDCSFTLALAVVAPPKNRFSRHLVLHKCIKPSTRSRSICFV